MRSAELKENVSLAECWGDPCSVRVASAPSHLSNHQCCSIQETASVHKQSQGSSSKGAYVCSDDGAVILKSQAVLHMSAIVITAKTEW